jgi:protein-tyrosine phosphatase
MTLITAQLALGNSKDPQLYADHIDAALCCAREIPLVRKKPGHHLKLDDGHAIPDVYLANAYEFLDQHLAAKHLVLVYCAQGISRSASVLCGYLALKSGEPLDQVLDSVRRLRPAVDPTKSTFEAVKKYVERHR